jgi:pyruvate/2-oxoglutarate dehydrogenase complex dihydrolipoamide dehydrogenase (E3) component
METSIPGVYAAGDVRYGSVKRVASAVGAGAIAIQSVHEHFVKARLGLDDPLLAAPTSARAGANPAGADVGAEGGESGGSTSAT